MSETCRFKWKRNEKNMDCNTGSFEYIKVLGGVLGMLKPGVPGLGFTRSKVFRV